MAQGKTKIKSNLPPNAKQSGSKGTKKNPAFQKRKRKKLDKFSFSLNFLASTNFILYSRCTSSEENGREIKDSRGHHKVGKQEK